jgi:CDGSH-type Zn-finger protein/truncated hemoglobin YjbI
MAEHQDRGNQAATQGRLAQVIATRGGQAPPEAPFVIEHREALIYMLCEASELEHGIMCQYLFAAFSMKQSADEGLTQTQLAAVQRWRQQISHIATQEMLHLALVQNLLSAIGGAPHMSRPNFPQPARHYPAGVHLALLPFGEQALRHFMYLERPEGMALHDADGLAAFGRASPVMQPADIVPRGQDFATVGHLYRSIEAGIAHLADKYGERWLFIGPPRGQATSEHFGWPQLTAVTGVASAQRAIEEILDQGEGPRGDWRDAHFGQFVAILDEFEQLREADRGFDPARPVLALNVRPSERDATDPLATDPVTRGVMDLFNVSYEILLQILQRFFAHTEETDAELKALADATVSLMFRVIKPLGDLITQLPAGPEYPGRTAAPSFELFYESDYVLPHREAAWVLLIERVEEAAAFCESIQPAPDVEPAAGLASVRAALRDIAQSLAAHVPARPAAVPGRVLSAEAARSLLARARELCLTTTAVPGDDPVSSGLATLLREAYSVLEQTLRSESAGTSATTAARLCDSVLRPLADALRRRRPAGNGHGAEAAASGAPRAGEDTAAGDDAGSPDVGELAWRVAQSATRLRVGLPVGTAPPELEEAVAALQDVAVGLIAGQLREERIAVLRELHRGLPPTIVVAKNGPYLVTNVPEVRTHLGRRLVLPPQLALCRCGGSSIKPLCDGTHARNGFADEKDPGRVPDRRDTYPGLELTIFDNRGICQHSGFCTDRLATVFRTDSEPFIAPSGGRMDEIIRAVRDCPSGALSLGVDGQEARDLADWHNKRDPAIEVSLDGPYRVTGGIPLADASGTMLASASGPATPAVGASTDHYALCRCGHSRNKPFCSGMHWYSGFRDPVPAAGVTPTLFEWAGGLPALTRMTRLLYEKLVPADALLAPVFAGLPPGHARREADWLAEVFGEPAQYSEQRGTGAAALAHAGRDFTEEQRARWVALATLAADEAGLPADPAFRAALSGYLDWGSRTALAQSASDAGPPADTGMPRWDWGPGGTPDPGPGQAIPAEEVQPAALPAPDAPVSFEAHIRPLFRSRDRQSMLFAFDLWSHSDVQAHAADILARLRGGTMPCDGAWPLDRIGVFQRWAESGCQP